MHHRALQYCRGREVLRRESLNPGSFSEGAIEYAWMQSTGPQNSGEKINAVYLASRTNKIPVQVLTGALYQESMFSELGIAEDGGNYSCGVGQVNLVEWCRWANNQSIDKKKELGWPLQLSCSNLNPALIKPFYEIAKTRLGGLPEYRLNRTHFENIKFEQVVGGFPAGPIELQKSQFLASQSFIRKCESPSNGIAAKANELISLYNNHVPPGLKNREKYKSGDKFQRTCAQRGFEELYPLHSGWLMAVGSYNAGPRAIDALAHYNRWNVNQVMDPKTFSGVGPTELVEGLYWSGSYDSKDDKIHFKLLNGAESTWNWFKLCVLQRHIARVANHVSLPGISLPVDSLEGAFRCAKSEFDPKTGELIKSGVPPHRQKSAGQKPLPGRF